MMSPSALSSSLEAAENELENLKNYKKAKIENDS